jgi:hypothetical protein
MSFNHNDFSPRILPVIKRTLGHALALLAAGISPLLAANSAATVTEAVNQVSHGSAESAATTPAKAGTVIEDGEYLKTGVKSRAELSLADQSITRLGANTIFNYSVANNEVDLQAGTILFSKPKDGKEMTIKTASVTAAIVGTTGFVSLRNKALLFGLIEGRARVTVGGAVYPIGAGEILQLLPGGKPQVFFYDVPKFLATSPLVTKYHAPLPNQAYVDHEVASYGDSVARGFTAPPTQPYFVSTVEASVPLQPVPARDSAANALNNFNHLPGQDQPRQPYNPYPPYQQGNFGP